MSGERIGKLSRYDLVVGDLQETKWLSCGTYEVGDTIVLISSRCTPGEGQSVQRVGTCAEGDSSGRFKV